MTPYSSLSVMSHVVFSSCAIILALGAVFLLVDVWLLHINRRYFVGSVALTTVMMFVFQGIDDVSNRICGGIKNVTFFGKAIGVLPWTAVAAILVLIAAAEIFLLAALIKRRKKLLPESAVKESLDSLPDGVCIYAADGQPLLVNRQMQRISGELFDSEIMNVNRFQARLCKKAAENGASMIRTEPTVIAQTADGRVWDFHCRPLAVEKSELYELIAFDITEQYRLGAELRQRNERLKRVNERLRRFSEEMVTLTAEKELLNAKIDVHDNLGRSLLACRAYFLQEREKRSRKDLLSQWRYVFSIMKNETLPSCEGELPKKTADMLGIAVEITGTLPENRTIRTAVVTAIGECLTNTANHAGGDKVFVRICEDDTAVTAELTNTGKPPSDEIRESGGLKNLRHIAEQAGGTMTIESTPRFLLRLEFRKGEQGEWQKQEYWS